VQQREYVDYIEQGGRHLLSLINEVLDLSAIEAGKLVIDIDDVRLARLIDECLTLVSPLAAGRGIRMQHDIPPELTVRADRKRLKQVVINLVSNAIKYNRPDGDVRITCSRAGGGGAWSMTPGPASRPNRSTASSAPSSAWRTRISKEPASAWPSPAAWSS
jgi:signal transduction histidine kinase